MDYDLNPIPGFIDRKKAKPVWGNVTNTYPENKYDVQVGARDFVFPQLGVNSQNGQYNTSKVFYPGDFVCVCFTDGNPHLPFILAPYGPTGGGVTSLSILQGIWPQGGGDELIDSSSISYGFYYSVNQGLFVPVSSGGFTPTLQFSSVISDATEEPNGIVAFNALDGNGYLAWLTRNHIDGSHSALTLNLFQNFSGGASIPVATVANRTILNNDTGQNYGFLFADRNTGLVWILGSAADMFSVYIVDPVRQQVVLTKSMPYEVHQSSVGLGYFFKMWHTHRAPTYPTDRPQLDGMMRFYKFQPQSGLTDADIVPTQFPTFDPQSILAGYQLANSKAHGSIGLYIASSEGRWPFIEITNEIVVWISGWKPPTNSVEDAWMNNGFEFGFVTVGPNVYQQPISIFSNNDLIGGHRLQSARVVWINPDTGTKRIVVVPDNTPLGVNDNNSVSAWDSYYAALANTPPGGSALPIGSSPANQYYTHGVVTYAGVATNATLELGGSQTVLIYHDTSGMTPDGFVTVSSTGMNVGASSPDSSNPQSAASGSLDGIHASPLIPHIPYPDYNFFEAGHQVLLPIDEIRAENDVPDGWTQQNVADDLIEWPTDNDVSMFTTCDPVGGISIESQPVSFPSGPPTERGWFCYFEAYVILEGQSEQNTHATLVPQFSGSTTSYTSNFFQYYYGFNAVSYMCLQPRMMGRTWLAVADPNPDSMAPFQRIDISNYLPYEVIVPGGSPLDALTSTTTPASLQHAPLDTTLWEPIIIQVCNVIMLIRVWRDTLYPSTTGTEQEAYPIVQLWDNRNLTAIGSNYTMNNYNTVISLTGGGYARQYDFFQDRPVQVKGCLDGSGNPTVNIFLHGVQNFADGSSSDIFMQWQFVFDGTGSTQTPTAVNQYVIPFDGTNNQPTNPSEIGSLCFANNSAYWSASTNTSGSTFSITQQSLS